MEIFRDSEYYARAGRTGGKKRTEKKIAASRENVARARYIRNLRLENLLHELEIRPLDEKKRDQPQFAVFHADKRLTRSMPEWEAQAWIDDRLNP